MSSKGEAWRRRTEIGKAADLHDDKRGILLVSDAAWPDEGFRGYEQAVRLLHAGVWVPLPSASEAQTRAVALTEETVGPDPEAREAYNNALREMDGLVDAVGKENVNPELLAIIKSLRR